MTLQVRENTTISLTPDEVIANATVQAKLLMNIVEQTHCYQTISGKKYLQVEAWETIGAFNRVHAVTDWINPIFRDEKTVGYDAKVNLIKDEQIVGSAIMSCYFTENACKGKEGDAKDKACKSAAQTFATSKAYRMNYSYVAILAGFEPTLAEEITGESSDDKPATEKQKEHWCEKHNAKFFKSAKMKTYAHPIDGTNPVEWCNEEQPTQQPVVGKEATKQEKPTNGELTTKQGLLTWVFSHKIKAGVDQIASWITNQETNQPYKEMKDIPDKPEIIKKAYGEIKNMQGWD
jgi:hypothetical protein